jgi:psp operon transcriptional activator
MALELGWENWPGFGSAALDRLLSYDWPGNIRELRNVVERAVYRWNDPDNAIEAVQFYPFASPWRPAANDVAPQQGGSVPFQSPGQIQLPSSATTYDPVNCEDFRLALAEYEKAILKAALEKCRWNQRAAAAALQLSYDQLRHAMKRHDLTGQ